MNEYALTTEIMDTPVSIYPFTLLKKMYNLDGNCRDYIIDIDIHELKMKKSDNEFVILEIDKPIENRTISICSNQLGIFKHGVGEFNYSVKLPNKNNRYELIFKNTSSSILGVSFTLTATKLSSMSLSDKIDKSFKRYCFINNKNIDAHKKVFIQSVELIQNLTDIYPDLEKYKIYDIGDTFDNYYGIVCAMSKDDIFGIIESINDPITIDKYKSSSILGDDINCDYTVMIL